MKITLSIGDLQHTLVLRDEPGEIAKAAAILEEWANMARLYSGDQWTPEQISQFAHKEILMRSKA